LPTREPHRLARYAVARVSELLDHPAELRAELARVHEAFDVEFTVYDAGGALAASSVEPPLPLPPPDERPRYGEAPRHLNARGFAFVAALPGDRGAVVISGGPREGLLLRVAIAIAAVLLALAIGSWPFARSIARPLEQLTAAVGRLGAGDLGTRANLAAGGEVGALGAAFDDMAARLEVLVRGEKELIANVSHELRTPLARMRMALALAEEGDVARARKALTEIGGDVGELERLTDEILAAARLDLVGQGGLPLHRERVEVAALLEEAGERFRAGHPDRELTVDAAGEVPVLDADPALLRRLLGNLLDNAAKYSEAPAPVALTARLAPPARGADAHPPEAGAPAGAEGVDGPLEVVLEVRDHGIGVAEEDLPRLFTPFFRTDRSRARDSGGVGLGLALVRRIAEAHGGRVTAGRADGGGTVFQVTLPAAG
jgi:signal transduction histidine kinase